MHSAISIKQVIESGLCIGCGLCESITHGRVKMIATANGSLRPAIAAGFSAEEEAKLLSACPGVRVEPRYPQARHHDPVWGAYLRMQYAWAGDAGIRFKAATGGVLTALGVHLLKSGAVAFILHVGADAARPMRNRWLISDTQQQVIANSSSRYSPVAPLAGLDTALSRNQPFAVIAKPCDLSALHRYGQIEPRLEKYCVLRLAMVCGGQSRMSKSQAVLRSFGVNESEVAVFRHRGYGNPGLLHIETDDGRVFEKTYLELWGDESGWELETRCKVCPDALGEAADVASADVWPGGNPSGEDEGFNGIIVRSTAGQQLVDAAADSGDLVLGAPISAAQFNDFQPHQVRKKQRLSARFAGLNQAGLPRIETPGLRIEDLGQQLSPADREAEIAGTVRRVKAGKVTEATRRGGQVKRLKK